MIIIAMKKHKKILIEKTEVLIKLMKVINLHNLERQVLIADFWTKLKKHRNSLKRIEHTNIFKLNLNLSKNQFIIII